MFVGVGGESYLDVIERIRPVIIGTLNNLVNYYYSFFVYTFTRIYIFEYFALELERQRRSVVVICHLAVMRCIVAYFMGVKLDEIPFQNFRRHFVYELSPGPFGCPMKEVSPTEELRHM